MRETHQLLTYTHSLGSNEMGNEGAKALADALAGNEIVKSI